VVATPLAADGLGLADGEHFLEGDSPPRLAERVLELLRAPERRDSLARAGRDYAEAHWSLLKVAELQNALCARVLP
jgi:hypothetical protein